MTCGLYGKEYIRAVIRMGIYVPEPKPNIDTSIDLFTYELHARLHERLHQLQ